MSGSTVGWKIKMYRKLRGLTQAQLSEKSGVAAITIRQYETDKRQPRIEQLRKIATALDVGLDKLVDVSSVSQSLNATIPFVDILSNIEKKPRVDGKILLSAEERDQIQELAKLVDNIPGEILDSEFLEKAMRNEYIELFDTFNFEGKYLALKMVSDLSYQSDFCKDKTTPQAEAQGVDPVSDPDTTR